MQDIKVFVVEFSDRKFYMMQFVDPVTGRKKTRSTKVERTGRKKEQTEAERVAAKWEAELREGRGAGPSKLSWADFRERYESEVLTGLAATTGEKVASIFNRLERLLNPARLLELTAERLSYFQAKSREMGLSESTIKGDLAHLKAALRWAERVGLLVKVPKIEMPKRAKSTKMMKGRPITTEEFERMLDKVADVVGADDADSWKFYLKGLWCSGLRLAESLELYWDNDNKLRVDLSGRHPMLRIPGDLEKGNKDRLLPMAPEFAELLLAKPEAERIGRVFNLTTKAARAEQPTAWWACRIICRVGELAGVKVSTDPRTGKVKYASAHDLRRSFGERWSTRIMPTDLMVLMRHESIETTLKFYVGRNCQRTAATLWEAHQKAAVGNTFGNTRPTATFSTPEELNESVYRD